jgi:uncharacterized protein YndB with AHSA1/START domain
MAKDVVQEFDYPQPPEKVWHALTDQGALRETFADNDFEPVPGSAFQFRTKPRPGFSGVIDGTVTDVQEGRRLSYTWRAERLKSPTTVTWELEPTARGTRLRLRHSGFEGFGGRILATMHSAGWKRFMQKALPRYLERS